MARVPGPPPMEGLRRQIERRRRETNAGQGHFVRETFCLERAEARRKAREWFERSVKTAGGWPGFGFIVSEVELTRLR